MAAVNSTNTFSYLLYWTILGLSRRFKIFRYLIDYSALYYYRFFRSSKTFIYDGNSYKYFYHPYNRTVASERIVEVSIAKKLIDQFEGQKILEFGNVMSHYFPTSYHILDKYEKGKRVINKDVINVKLPTKYDLIFGVSTMEHVGYSYGEKIEKDKIQKGIKNLKKYLNKGGTLFLTFPLYYNPFLTELLLNNSKRKTFTKLSFMKRVSFVNEWKQISQKEAMLESKYDGYYANANILCIATFKND